MKKFCYPAIFHPEEVGYSVDVPDFEKVNFGCSTCGDTFEEACDMAFDAIGLCIDTILEDGTALPEATKPELLSKSDGDFVVPIVVDMQKYYQSVSTKSVKKTLSIPEWLSNMAEKENISLSKLLQKALAAELGVEL